ncbi:MAG: hypothetical protein QCI82_10955 [Candidatus Thermoplasmatota archaeon]|nr:hypothetical protein [Candidatus Thermoplasmatota archaeon]
MVQLDSGSKEAMIVSVLLKRYPIDDQEIATMTGLSIKEVRRLLKGMEDRGWLLLDRLPDRHYVRLLRRDFTFVGRVQTQKRPVKHKNRDRSKDRIKEKILRDEHDVIMYA